MAIFQEHSWKDLTIWIGGTPLGTIVNFRYRIAQDKRFYHGAGAPPRAILKGAITYEAEITVSERGYNALLRGANYNALIEIRNITIVGVFLNKDDPTRVHVITATGGEFTEGGTTVSQGDGTIYYTLPMLLMEIKESAANAGRLLPRGI